MKHTPREPDAPLFEQSGKGFNYREMARAVRPDVAAKLAAHPRDAAIEAVGKGREDFIERARAFVLSFKPERRFTGEDAIEAAAIVGLVADEPRVWGNVFNGLSRDGLIEKTGEFRTRVNGNPTPVWRVFERK